MSPPIQFVLVWQNGRYGTHFVSRLQKNALLLVTKLSVKEDQKQLMNVLLDYLPWPWILATAIPMSK